MELALYGGKPVRDTLLGYGHQYIDNNDIVAVTDVLKSDFLTCGPKVRQMENDICRRTNAKYCVAVSNGTAALHVACMAAGITKGDEVIVSSVTFAASANCVLYCGGTPVFADIDKETCNISPASIESCITEKTKAVIAVDFMGQAVELNEIRAICDKYNLLLIEDAAHSIGTKYNNKPVGSIADITTFSFHPVKTITCGEGGAVVTNNENLYKKAALFATHGITRDADLMHNKDEGAWYYEQLCLGYNYRLSDIQAALLSSQLEKLDKFILRRKEIVNIYNREFADITDLIQLTKEIEKSDTARHLYVINLKLENLKTDRKTIFNALREENIGVNVHYIPVYWLPYYESLGYKKGLCPNAEKYYLSAITLPLHYCMTDKDINDVIVAVKKVLNYFRK